MDDTRACGARSKGCGVFSIVVGREIVRTGKIVYEGEITDLKRGAGTSYRLATTDDDRALAVCRAQRGIAEVRTQHHRISFTADEAAVTELSQALIEAGALIRELAPQNVTLEDLFFSLTEGTDGADGAADAQGAEAAGGGGGGPPGAAREPTPPVRSTP